MAWFAYNGINPKVAADNAANRIPLTLSISFFKKRCESSKFSHNFLLLRDNPYICS